MMEVRDGDAHDVPAIMPIMLDAFHPDFGERWTAAQCLSILTLPGSSLLLAYSHNIITGFALTRSVLDEEELLMIGVGKNHQNGGVGTNLVHHIIKRGQNNLRKKLYLEVRSNNIARKFYFGFGFRDAGIRKNYYAIANGQTLDAITMRLEI